MKIRLLIPLVFIFTFSMAQKKFNYDAKWKEVESMEKSNLSKSLLPAVNEIYAQAKKENNEEQLIKSLLYRSRINLGVSDTDSIEYEVVSDFRKEIKDAKGPGKAILQSLLAESLLQYWNENRWWGSGRTRSEETLSDDFRFWDEEDFKKEIDGLYLQSVSNTALLQNEPIYNWNMLTEGSQVYREFRPTLYDVLAHRALKVLSSHSGYYNSFKSTDPELDRKRAEEILNELIRFHQSRGNMAAAAYNELELLKFELKSKEINNAQYGEELLSLLNKNPDNNFTVYLLAELADFYKSQITKTPTKEYQKRKELTEKTIDYLDKVIARGGNSDLVKSAKETKKGLLGPDFQVVIEEYLSAEKNIPVQVSHQNLDKLYYKILPYDESLLELYKEVTGYYNKNQSALNKLLRKAPPISESFWELKSFDDYQPHSTIAKIDPLPSGQYLFLISNDPLFRIDKEETVFDIKHINSTNYAIIFRDQELLVTERESGKPVPGITVEQYIEEQRRTRRGVDLITDKNGLTKTSAGGNYSTSMWFKVGDEDVEFSNTLYRYSDDRKKEKIKSTKFFTDRGIYRPGQPLYFKIILYETDTDGSTKVLADENVTISLKDANRQEVSRLSLRTNAYGSAWGEFVLPSTGLTGNFTLSEVSGKQSTGTYSFRVEEYKRPKFEVTFDKITDTFRLEEEISIKGNAMSYAGVNIDNAKVNYRVFRQPIYPYRPWWYPGPQSEPAEEIAHGTVETDSNGDFTIAFLAKPAAGSDKGKRTYTYRITADVTDLNGETRSGEQSVTVGDLRYILDIPIDGRINADTWEDIKINTQNLNGEFAPAEGRVSLTKITPPQRVLRNSPLSTGDYELYSKEEFIAYFPHEPYGNENDKENWEKGRSVINENFDTEKSDKLKITPKDWQEGYYVLDAFIIDGNDSIPYSRLVYLYHTAKMKPADREFFSVDLDKKEYKPGDTASLNIASVTTDSEVLVQLEANGKIIKTEKIPLNNDIKTFSFPITEEYRGDVFLHYYFGKYNTATYGRTTVRVPFPDKSLKVTAATLRDKLTPGQEEVWELTVSGEEKDKVLAEMLAGMYDASLDQFKSNSLDFPMRINRNLSKVSYWQPSRSFSTNYSSPNIRYKWLDSHIYYYFSFEDLNRFDFYLSPYGGGQVLLESVVVGAYDSKVSRKNKRAAMMVEYEAMPAPQPDSSGSMDAAMGAAPEEDDLPEEDPALNQVQARKALQETAFFYPDLMTDKDGNVKIRFTVPESLTQWKFMALAHTPELRTGYFETLVRTQKDLMIIPNPPRFLREGDTIVFQAKVSNLSEEELKGQAKLILFDAFTMQPVDEQFGNLQAVRNITVAKGNSDNVSWTLHVPKNMQAVVYRVVASAGDFSDGEESALPILTNRMMVTESLPLFVREGQEKTFVLNKLKENESTTLDNFKLTFEMTTNPIWYAIFSLPYLREYPYDCSEQVFARLYGNLVSEHLINSNPKIKAVFDDWNRKGELKSKLEQNEELKSLLLEETPWVRQAENESEQMKRIALLFDLNQMQRELDITFSKLKQKQSASGGFPWFEGGYDNRYITTHIVAGFGQLQAMGINTGEKKGLDTMLKKAIEYIDVEMAKEYREYEKNKKRKPSVYNGMQWLYARSHFLKTYPLNPKSEQIKNYFLKEIDKDKFDQGLQTQAMAALVLYRYGKEKQARELILSVKDHAVESDEMGMYWKNNLPGWFWYQAPVETQALLIKAFDEIIQDTESVESMKVWLLKNRQTNRWVSTKATTEAVYALMNTGKDWIGAEEGVTVKIGSETLDMNALEKAPQSGSGYVKTSWSGKEITPEMATVEVEKTTPGVAWGAMYWQYFEDLDKISSAKTGVRFKKELFLKKNTDKGPTLIRITEETPIEIGDLVTVRLEIQTDRDMEFIHIKDMRASGFEPVNVLSGFRWQDGLGYYESTRDAATNFFADRMQKGTYVFEYDVRANNAGNFSNGITTLQCMYAPELSAHSEGIRVDIQ